MQYFFTSEEILNVHSSTMTDTEKRLHKFLDGLEIYEVNLDIMLSI
jgi:hypothetical protein